MSKMKNVVITRHNYFGDENPTPEQVQEVLDYLNDEPDCIFLEGLKNCVENHPDSTEKRSPHNPSDELNEEFGDVLWNVQGT